LTQETNLTELIKQAAIRDNPDKVLIAFITSTTINVVGLFVVVAKWMFPTVQNNTNEKANQSIHADAKSRAGD